MTDSTRRTPRFPASVTSIDVTRTKDPPPPLCEIVGCDDPPSWPWDLQDGGPFRYVCAYHSREMALMLSGGKALPVFTDPVR